MVTARFGGADMRDTYGVGLHGEMDASKGKEAGRIVGLEGKQMEIGDVNHLWELHREWVAE
jgi:hypothetical protein